MKGAIIISAGFKESGKAGAELERQVLEEARRGHMRIIGPNCLGVMSPPHWIERYLRHYHRTAGSRDVRCMNVWSEICGGDTP